MLYNINTKTTALLLIDPQREYFDEDQALYTPNAKEIRSALSRLKHAAEAAGVLTVLVLHSHRADGSDVGRMGDFDPTPVFTEGTVGVEPIPELAPAPGDLVVIKTRYSAFVGTDLESILKTRGIDTVVISGLMTNFCCVSTARSAHDLDFKTIFVADACSGPDMPDLGFGEVSHAEVRRVVSASLAAGVAEVVTVDQVLAQLGFASRLELAD